MSASARRGAIVVALAVVVGLGCWWGLRSETDHGRGDARAIAEKPTADASTPDARAPRHREKAETDATSTDESAAPEPPAKPETLTIHVLSADDDAPIAGATVRAMKDYGGDETIATVTSDVAGVARITIERGLDSVREFLVRGPGFIQARCGHPDRENGGDAEMTLRLQSGTALDGVVVDAKTGDPLAGVRVVAEFGGQRNPGFGLPELPYDEAVTGADGKFRLDGVPPQTEVSVTAAAPGHVERDEHWTADKPRRFEFRLDPSGSIRGVVRDLDGKPAKGVDVDCEAGGATTHDDGAYEITGLPLIEASDTWAGWDVYAKKGYPVERASSVTHGVLVTAEAPVAVRDLVLLKRASLTLHVHMGVSDLVPDAYVTLESASVTQYPKLDGNGDAEIVVAQPGRCRVAVVSSEFVPYDETIEISEGKSRALDVAMESGAAIVGVVVDELGEPVADVELEAERADRAAWPRLYPSQRAQTAADGTFRLTGCVAAEYDVTAYGPAGLETATIAKVAAPKDTLRIVLAAALDGAVRFTLRGLPAGSHDVRVALAFRSAAACVSRACDWNEGEAAECAVHVGKYDVVLSVDGFAPVMRHVEVVADAKADLGEIALQRGVAVAGRVVDSRGNGVVGATVRALVGDSKSTPVTWTDATGAFRLFRMPSSGVSFWVWADGFAASEVAYKPSPDSAPLVVTLFRGGVLKVRVVDPARRHDPDELAVVVAGPLVDGEAPKKPESLDSGDDGVFVKRLAPGRWRLRVIGEDDAVIATKDVEIRDEADTPVELVLDK